MAVSLPDGATVHIANALAAEKKITAITNAAPPVATCTGHGLATGDFIVLNTGWGEFHERVFKVEQVNANDFKIVGIDAKSAAEYPAAAGVGTFQKVNGWTQIKQVLSSQFSGGEQQFATYAFLEDDFERQIPTVTSAASMTFSIADDPTLAGYQAARVATKSGKMYPLRIDLKNGGQIAYNGYAALNETPSLDKGNVMAVSLTYALAGKPVRY